MKGLIKSLLFSALILIAFGTASGEAAGTANGTSSWAAEAASGVSAVTEAGSHSDKSQVTGNGPMVLSVSWATETDTAFSDDVQAPSNDEIKYTIRGRVSDIVGDPLPGATVVLEETYLGAVAGYDGYYSIEGVRGGSYNIRVSFIGYGTVVSKVLVDSDIVKDFELEFSSVTADEIVVKGTRAGTRTPVTFSEIKSDEIKKKNFATDITHMLSMVPSLVETSESGIGVGYTNFRIRGSDPSRINVTIDGIPVNDSESQQVFWVNMPDLAGSVSDIQIQRGVGTSTNGSGAFGATVNLRTENPSSVPYAEISSTWGSFNTIKGSAKLGTGLIGERFMMDMRLSGLKSDGYVDRSGSDHTSLFATAVYNLSKGRFKLNLLHGNERTGISWWGVPYDSLATNRTFNPAGMYTNEDGETAYYHNQTDRYTQTHVHLIFNWQFSPHLYLNAAGHFTRGLGYYEQYREDESLEDYGLNPFTINEPGFFPVVIYSSDLVRRKWLYNHFKGVTYSLHYNSGPIEIIVGGGANRYLGDHFGRIIWMRYAGFTEKDYRWYLNGATKDDINVYTRINYSAGEKLSLYGDLQYRYIGYRMAGHDDDLRDLTMEHNYNFFNPKAGLFYRFSANHESYLSVAVANREPTRANYKDAAGDPESMPQPELMTDLEAGYRFNSVLSTAAVNLYFMNYRDQLVPTGELSNTGYPIMTNVESSYRAGIELTASVKPLSRVRMDAALTLSRNRIRNFTEYYIDYISATDEEVPSSKFLGDVDIAYSPSVVGMAGIAVDPLKNLTLTLTGKYVGSQYFDNTMNSERGLNPYFTSSLRVDYSPLTGKLAEKADIQLLVNNIFNSLYVSNAYGGNWYVDGQEYSWAGYFPQAGINFMARLTVRF
ncbi:MAG: TonB-dependent receptor [Bacteroidales bacterium]|nr:TonB-dependent receptor [Bacteroidales bacterium]